MALSVVLALGSLAALAGALMSWMDNERLPWSLPGLLMLVASAILAVEAREAYRRRRR